MTASQTSSSASATQFTYSSLQNLFGILMSIILIVILLVFGGHALKYIKNYACKIKIIMSRSKDKNIKLKEFNYELREGIKNTKIFNKIETIFKNEIVKSRSLFFWSIFRGFMNKYNHMGYYFFRDKLSDHYDLLKPTISFYNLLNILAVATVWMITIFISTILQHNYADISQIPVGTFVGLVIVIGLISSAFIILVTNRLFKMYNVTIKGAFA